jgi:hypothetical protein
MKLARYWTKESGEATGADGGRIRVVSRGWSDESLEDAARRARETARKLAAALASGQIERSHYLYGTRPLPEPIVRELAAGAALVTRNSYGALVLNTSHLMFIDIDRDDPAPAAGVLSGLRSLFGKPAAAPRQAPALDDIQAVSEKNGLSVRAYKTAAGYRAIVTNAPYEAADGRTEALLQQFGSDPLYIRLCHSQESFRARLTPKPWRCGVALPPASFPFTTPDEESRFRHWEAEYSSKIRQYATCRYLASFGPGRIDTGLDGLIKYHDAETHAAADLPLA